MAILAKNEGQKRELVEAGMHVARCIKMLELGSCQESINGVPKTLQKVNLTWELPNSTKVFEEAKGAQPMLISKEFTISMNEKSNLRKTLESWRGKNYTEEEAKSVDITKLLGQPCMLNITHKPSKGDASKVYEDISAVVPVMKGMTVPAQVTPSVELSYDKWDEEEFKKLPDFLKKKMEATPEYASLRASQKGTTTTTSDLPWEQPDATSEEVEEQLPF